jgi:hypothetical protein
VDQPVSNSAPPPPTKARPQRPITKWNLLALLVGLVGAAATLSIDQLWVLQWIDSGIHFRVGVMVKASLPAGETLVYYESPATVPAADVQLRLLNGTGNVVSLGKPSGDISYGSLATGWSGRALWILDASEAATYDLVCYNHTYERDEDRPPDDRVTFFKTPNSLDQMKFVRTLVQVTGATITMTMVIVCYVLHGLTLQKRLFQSQIA